MMRDEQPTDDKQTPAVLTTATACLPSVCTYCPAHHLPIPYICDPSVLSMVHPSSS